MEQQELKQVIEQGESETIEFKESFGNEAIETVGAFANTKGGVILIGVNRRGNIIGVQATQETLKDWANQISQCSEPTFTPLFEIVPTDDGKVVAIRVSEYPLKPVSIRGRCYRRFNASNHQMTPDEIAQMHLYSIGSSFDAISSPNATLDDISEDKIRDYLQKANATGRRNYDISKPPLQLLEKVELIKSGKPTIAAVLLFGKEPHNKIHQAIVHCGRFKEVTTIIDDRLIEGTIIEQIDEVMAFLRKNTNVRFVFTGKPEREEVWDYPLEAMREAVTNAICHRDYADTSDIQIKIHDDYLTIWNPGGLLPGMSIAELYDPNHSSKPRNRLIAQVFYDIKLIEKYGSGIQRILTECEKAHIPAPTFEEKFGGFLVTFRKDQYTDYNLKKMGLNERQIKALAHIKKTGRITNTEYQEITNSIKRTASRDLKELVNKKIIQQIGITGRGTEYILTGHNGDKRDIKGT